MVDVEFTFRMGLHEIRYSYLLGLFPYNRTLFIYSPITPCFFLRLPVQIHPIRPGGIMLFNWTNAGQTMSTLAHRYIGHKMISCTHQLSPNEL